MTPLGWVINRLGNAIETEPALLEPLLELDQARMHLIALALAHLSSEVCPDLALVLLRGPYREILDLSLGHRPPGLARALACLPPKVLTAESYRKLTALLTDRTTARFLHHCQSIDEAMIAGLHRLPADLRRPAILAMFGRVEGMDRFVDGLRCLAARAGEIRTLAKNWQNCLADYMFNINDATCAIYRTDLPDQPAACFVYRQWRLGWFLQQAKGPRNIDLEPQQLAQTYSVFANAGILQSSIIEAIKTLILTNEWSGRHNRHDLTADEDELWDGN